MTRARLALALIVIAVIAAAGLALRARRPRAVETQRPVRTATAEPADFHVTVRVTGYLDAAQTSPVVSASGGGGGRGSQAPRIVWSLDDGAWVTEGDPVMRLDGAVMEQQVRQLESQVAESEERVRAAEADGEKRVQNAHAALVKAEEALQLARTQNEAALERAAAEVAYQEKELDVATGQLEKRRRLVAERLMPLAEVEAAEDEVRQRELNLAQARRQLDRAQTDSEMVERLRNMDLEKAQLELEQAEAAREQSVTAAQRNLAARQAELDDAAAQLIATEVRSPATGLLLLSRNWRGDPLRVGDEVSEQQKVADVIDPAEMWVRCDISESEIERVHVDQEATVLVPGLGDRVLPGRVAAIDNLARERMWFEGGVPGKKVFAALVDLTERDERLRPGMGASVEIRLERITTGIAVPAEAVLEAGGKSIVYRREGDGYRAVPVEVVGRGQLLASVTGELKSGDVVACEEPPAALITSAEEKP